MRTRYTRLVALVVLAIALHSGKAMGQFRAGERVVTAKMLGFRTVSFDNTALSQFRISAIGGGLLSNQTSGTWAKYSMGTTIQGGCQYGLIIFSSIMPFSRSQFAQVTPGMTLAEAQRILGVPLPQAPTTNYILEAHGIVFHVRSGVIESLELENPRAFEDQALFPLFLELSFRSSSLALDDDLESDWTHDFSKWGDMSVRAWTLGLKLEKHSKRDFDRKRGGYFYAFIGAGPRKVQNGILEDKATAFCFDFGGGGMFENSLGLDIRMGFEMMSKIDLMLITLSAGLTFGL